MVFKNKWLYVICCFLTALWVTNGACLAGAVSDKISVQGRWVRSDAPYLIEITQAPDGQLQASYFNRKQIHVEKTETAVKDGLFYVMVLLKDVNYQGSYYLLSYDRVKDTLDGLYFHAASRQRFNVDFLRKSAT